ncbi:MAG TPA: hypothetical protein VGD52_16400 [Pseudoduganella sp.]
MELSKVQREILSCLRDAAGESSPREFVYVTEWLGHFPFGLYHRVNIDGTDLSQILPDGWQQSDIKRLEETCFVVKRSEWQDPNDTFHQKVTYAIA